IEQAERYFSRNRIAGVRFLNEHPGDLPRIIDEYPDAALFVPRSLVSARLGLSNVAVVAPGRPLTMDITARTVKPNAFASLFVRHLKLALEKDRSTPAERPVVSLRQVH